MALITKHMRRYLPPELRRRFDIAWRILPAPVREELRMFIRVVRAVDSPMSSFVRWSDGTICKPDQDFGGWFVYDPTSSPKCGYILLHAGFQDGPEVPAILTILHELAHAHEHMQDDWEAESRLQERSETASWLQVAAWVARSSAFHQEAIVMVTMAFDYALEEFTRWKLRP